MLIRTSIHPRIRTLLLALLAALLPGAAAHGQSDAPPLLAEQVLQQAGLDQRLNAVLPTELSFRDETGVERPLAAYLDGKPTLLTLIQFRCTMLCSEEMDLLIPSLKELAFTIGDEFNAVVVSIDHRETPEIAADFKDYYVREYDRPGAEGGFHFLTGDKNSIRQLADAIGYHFVYDQLTDQFAHPDAVIAVTPDGRAARYFFNLSYPPRDLRLALVEAGQGKIGSPLDAVALLCYRYDRTTGQYNLAILGLVRLGALVTLLGLIGGIALLSVRGGALGRMRLGRREARDA